MLKKRDILNEWARRYFVLDQNELSWFESSDQRWSSPLGSLDVKECTVESKPSTRVPYRLVVTGKRRKTGKKRTIQLACSDIDDLVHWQRAMEGEDPLEPDSQEFQVRRSRAATEFLQPADPDKNGNPVIIDGSQSETDTEAQAEDAPRASELAKAAAALDEPEEVPVEPAPAAATKATTDKPRRGKSKSPKPDPAGTTQGEDGPKGVPIVPAPDAATTDKPRRNKSTSPKSDLAETNAGESWQPKAHRHKRTRPRSISRKPAEAEANEKPAKPHHHNHPKQKSPATAATAEQDELPLPPPPRQEHPAKVQSSWDAFLAFLLCASETPSDADDQPARPPCEPAR